MVNYQNSKIYKIEPIGVYDLGDIYIGSTSVGLNERWTNHKKQFKRKENSTTSLFNKYGIENCRIILIEDFPCNCVDELRTRESYFIKTLACCNKNIPMQTAEGKKEKQRIYKINNQEKIKSREKIYNISYPEKKLQYRLANKDKIKLKDKNYRENNKEKIKKNQTDNKDKINTQRRARRKKAKETKKLNITI